MPTPATLGKLPKTIRLQKTTNASIEHPTVRVRKTFIQQLSTCGTQFTPSTLTAINTFINDIQAIHTTRISDLQAQVDAFQHQRSDFIARVDTLSTQFTTSIHQLLTPEPLSIKPPPLEPPPPPHSPQHLISQLSEWLKGRSADDLQSVRVELEHLATLLASIFPNIISPLLNDDIDMGYPLQRPIITPQSHINFRHYLHGCTESLNDNGDRGIHLAVLNNDVIELKRQCVALRLQQMNVDVANDEGMTPLHIAVSHNVSESQIMALLQYGARYNTVTSNNSNSLHLAAEHDSFEKLVRCLRSLNITLDAHLLNKHNADGYTPLHLAAIHGKCGSVRSLLSLGVNVNIADKKSGRTALYLAVEADEVDVARMLLEHGADVHAKNYAGWSVADAICDNDGEFSVEMRKLFYAERSSHFVYKHNEDDADYSAGDEEDAKWKTFSRKRRRV